MRRKPLTLKGAERLRIELRRLKTEDRPRVIQAIAEARAHGDLSENAEYHAAREQQGFIEGRIKQIEHDLSHCEIIDVSHLSATSRVVFGATVHLEDQDGGAEVVFQIVGEPRPMCGWLISITRRGGQRRATWSTWRPGANAHSNRGVRVWRQAAAGSPACPDSAVIQRNVRSLTSSDCAVASSSMSNVANADARPTFTSSSLSAVEFRDQVDRCPITTSTMGLRLWRGGGGCAGVKARGIDAIGIEGRPGTPLHAAAAQSNRRILAHYPLPLSARAMAKRSKSSARWLAEHAGPLRQRAQEGWRSRAAFKLEEIQRTTTC
jgi:transcription elongation factor GreA